MWTPGLAQLPVLHWCCTPAHEVSSITWLVLQNGRQQCPAGKNVKTKGRSIQLLNRVSVWTPGLAQLPMLAWCCTPVNKVTGITWSVLQNDGQQCPAGKNVPMKGRSIQLLNLSSINQWSFVKKKKIRIKPTYTVHDRNRNKTTFKRKQIIILLIVIMETLFVFLNVQL